MPHRSPNDKNSISQSNRTRLNRSLRVAYISYMLARVLRINKRTTARAGLLHDCGFDPGLTEPPVTQVVKHSSRGAIIARKLGERQDIVRAISSHMFPLNARSLPSSGQSLILWFADKMDSFPEFIGLSVLLDKRINDIANVTLLSSNRVSFSKRRKAEEKDRRFFT
jgi:putative nucleotidyltransferase with HDIG domain